MREELVEMLVCPVCHGELRWAVIERREGRIETAEAVCAACAATYPVREGIGLFLTPDLPRHDLWEEVESGLSQYLRAHPEVERRLMDTPLEALSPADQFLRAGPGCARAAVRQDGGWVGLQGGCGAEGLNVGRDRVGCKTPKGQVRDETASVRRRVSVPAGSRVGTDLLWSGQ
ncbi:MAG TPA: hypothetical protein G4O00_09005 [Thermoflexia bacterium]|nr:hypothetical protein [Thermoflexia bacterium]